VLAALRSRDGRLRIRKAFDDRQRNGLPAQLHAAVAIVTTREAPFVDRTLSGESNKLPPVNGGVSRLWLVVIIARAWEGGGDPSSSSWAAP
jgi:hypothetical protein